MIESTIKLSVDLLQIVLAVDFFDDFGRKNLYILRIIQFILNYNHTFFFVLRISARLE